LEITVTLKPSNIVDSVGLTTVSLTNLRIAELILYYKCGNYLKVLGKKV